MNGETDFKFMQCDHVSETALKYIDLNSYSSSPNFLGYSNYENSYSETGIETVCDDFLNKVISNNIGEIWKYHNLLTAASCHC